MDTELRTYSSEAEAQVAAALLRAHRIASRVVVLDPITLAGGASLRVGSADFARASELLASAASQAVPAEEPAAGSEPPPPPDAIEAGLAEIRRRRLFLWVVFLLYLPVVGGFGAIVHDPILIFCLAVSWMALFAFAGWRVSQSRCPRCSNPFHRRVLYHNIFTRRCLHCKQPLRPRRAGGGASPTRSSP